jgi:hypothetical protein
MNLLGVDRGRLVDLLHLVILLNLRDTHPDLRRSKSRLTSARLVLSEMLWLIIRLFMDPPWCNSGTIHVTIEIIRFFLENTLISFF